MLAAYPRAVVLLPSWIRHPIGTVLVAGALGAGGLIAINRQHTPVPPVGVTCDSSVSTRAALATAIASTGNAGKTVCVTAAITGAGLSVSTNMTSQARFIAQPADGTIDMVDVTFTNGAHNITLEGFEFTGEHSVDFTGTSTGIRYIRNNCHDQQATCIVNNNGAVINNLEVMGSRIVHITATQSFPTGYGLYTAGGTWNNLKVDYNYCEGTPSANSADCMELGGMNTFEIIGNDIHRDNDPSGQFHADGFMVWNDSTGGTIRDNVVLDGDDTLISGSTSSTLVQNNLIAREELVCVNSVPNDETSLSLKNVTFDHNTVMTCTTAFNPPSQGISIEGTTAGRGGVIFTNNIVDGLGCETAGTTTASSTGNLLTQPNPCGLPSGAAQNRFSFTPTWVSGTNSGDGSTYRISNAPTGYEGAGYQPAPKGPSACSC